MLGADIFHFNKKLSQQIPSNKRMVELSAENLIMTVKIIFAEYGHCENVKWLPPLPA